MKAIDADAWWEFDDESNIRCPECKEVTPLADEDGEEQDR